jgi:putative endonuclease
MIGSHVRERSNALGTSPMHHQGEWHATGNDTRTFPWATCSETGRNRLGLPAFSYDAYHRRGAICDLSNVPLGTVPPQNAVMTHLATGRVRMLELLIPAIDRWSGRKTLQQQKSTTAHLALGDHGEEAVYFHLRKKGCMVVARRWRSSRQPGDLDLVCWEGDTLCFVEVKTRSSFDVATAESAVDADKRRMIRRMARLYMSGLREQPKHVRFDIVSVYVNDEAAAELRVISNAFGWTEPAHRWN